MGRAARQTILDQFSPALFRTRMSRSIQTARDIWTNTQMGRSVSLSAKCIE